MKSIFHVEADTAEDLRAELITWFEDELHRIRNAAVSARLVRERHAAQDESIAIRRALNFWRSIHIDPKPRTDVVLPLSLTKKG